MSDDYPKVIVVDGVTITARDTDDEARWRAPVAPPNVPAESVPEPVTAVDPLADVSVEMDDPAFDAPTTKRTAHKKR